jgi:MFS family permease
MATIQQQPTTSPYTQKQINMALSASFLSYFIYAYFLQTLSTAAPRIAAQLDGVHLISWSVSIPSLGLIIGTLLAGKLSDIYGRRVVLSAFLAITLLGTILCAMSLTFTALIAARTVLCLGQGALGPLCFSVVGDLFVSSERSKWAGLLNISFGIPALVGPILSGWLVDNLSWRYIFLLIVPVIILCIIVLAKMPALIHGAAHKIDKFGAIYITIACTTLVFGLSFAGTTYPWGSPRVLILLAVSVLSWILFLRVESKVEEPLLSLAVLKNRTFITASGAGFLAFFGMTSMTLYYPLFMQGIQGISATRSGSIITPFGVLMAIIGIPTGLVLSRLKHYKRLYIIGYGMLTIAMLSIIFFTAESSPWWGVLIAVVGGLGLGSIPTMNLLVIQAAVPRKLLGVATSGLFFSAALGIALAPALLGSALNMHYRSSLEVSLPAALDGATDEGTKISLGNPKVLLDNPAMEALKQKLSANQDGEALFHQTMEAIRASLGVGLKAVFIICFGTMLMAFLLISTIPEIPMNAR